MIGAIPFIVLIGSGVIGFLIARYSKYYDAPGVILTFLSGTILFLMLIALPFARADSKEFIQEFKATQKTVAALRDRGISLETAGLIIKAVEANEKLAANLYWNSTVFDWYYSDQLKDLEPIH